ERNRLKDVPPVAPGVPAALGGRLRVEPVALPPEAWYPGLKPFVRREELAKRQAAVAAAEEALTQARSALAKKSAPADAAAAWRAADAGLVAARSELAWVRARLAADGARYLGEPGHPVELAWAAARAERQYQFDAAVAALARAEQQKKPTEAARQEVEAKRKQLAQ